MDPMPTIACLNDAGPLRRTLYGADGRFVVDNINEWQHSAMYAAFLLSGLVDLVGFYAPRGTLPAWLGAGVQCHHQASALHDIAAHSFHTARTSSTEH